MNVRWVSLNVIVNESSAVTVTLPVTTSFQEHAPSNAVLLRISVPALNVTGPWPSDGCVGLPTGLPSDSTPVVRS
jgi:hypothetical protein